MYSKRFQLLLASTLSSLIHSPELPERSFKKPNSGHIIALLFTVLRGMSWHLHTFKGLVWSGPWLSLQPQSILPLSLFTKHQPQWQSFYSLNMQALSYLWAIPYAVYSLLLAYSYFCSLSRLILLTHHPLLSFLIKYELQKGGTMNSLLLSYT